MREKRSLRIDLPTGPLLESELGWAAGIIDGEGTIGIYRQVTHGGGRGRSKFTQYENFDVRVKVGNTNLLLLRRFYEIVRVGVLYPNRGDVLRNPRRKPSFTWSASGADAAHCCRLLGPYLVIKKEHSDLLLAAAAMLQTPRDGRQRFVANPNKEALRVLKEKINPLNLRGVPQPGDLPKWTSR